MIITVVRYYKWPPPVIDDMYVDDIDYKGLVFWYNDAEAQDKKHKELMKNKNGLRS
ncbi:hypothetical protein [Flagellimonas nanhaiensis]|uniref:hypothetical protein n=1 Tax=Flagellimonas nanhaiensis TaxID=2292706 RepID=UPI0015F29435|nr:hypothetical protein [Allomuricauda nanhaiensis]